LDSIKNSWIYGTPLGLALALGSPKRQTMVRTALLICLVAFSTSAPQNLATATVMVVSAQSSHPPILITSNADFTTANGVTGGTGTVTDPYVISGWNVTGLTGSKAHPGTYVHVEIDNTIAYFVIRNISVQGSVNGNGQAAILSGVSNGRVESSNITAYCQTPPGLFCYLGLTVQSSTNVTLSGDIINQLSAGGDTNLVLEGSTIGPFGNFAGSGDSLDVNGCQHCLISGNNIVASGNFKISGGSDVTIANNNISADTQGGSWATSLLVGGGTGIRVTGNTVMGGVGDNIDLDRVSNATVSHNKVKMTAASPYGTGTGIAILSSNNVQVSQNSVVNACCVNGIGVLVGVSFNISPTNIRIFENNVTQAHPGISLQSATNVTIYHNNLFGNTVQATDDKPGSNRWDNGYPSGGNFWSDYQGVDNCSGPRQNVCPNPDGIGDTAYTFSTGHDNYPLMKPRTSILATVMRGTDNRLYWNKLSSGTWTGWGSLSGATPSAPTICSSGSNMILVVRGLDNGIYLKIFSNDMWSSSWNSPGGATNDQPACAILDSTLYLVVRGLDSVTYANSMSLATSTWSGWANLGGQTPSAPVLVGTSSANRLDLVVRGLANGIYHKAFVNGAWTLTWDTPRGATPDIPSAVSDGRAIDVVVRGMDNGLWYNSYNFTSGSWSNWFSIGGATATAPSLAIDSSGSLHLLVTGLANGIWHISRTPAGVWGPIWDSPGGSTPDRPALVQFGADIAVLVRGTNNSVFSDILGESSWYGWTDLGETTNSPLAISSL